MFHNYNYKQCNTTSEWGGAAPFLSVEKRDAKVGHPSFLEQQSFFERLSFLGWRSFLICLPLGLALVLAPLALAQQDAGPTTITANQAGGELLLEDVVHEALAANPALGRAATLVAAQRAHVAQVGVLPDPTVTLSWMGDPAPFKVMDNDPSSYRGLSVMQMVPLGGKRALQREVARKDVAVEEVSESAARRNLVTEARAAFFDYYYYGLALTITERNHQRLTQLADITESRYRVGKAMQQDVLRARLEISMLLQRTAALQQQRSLSAARLNTLMGRPAFAPLAAAAEPTPSTLPTLESLAPMAEANDLMLAREARMGERESAALALSRKDGIPDLSVGYMYQQRTGLPDMNGMQFTVNLPRLHRERLQQEIVEGELRVRAAKQAQQARKLELSYELQQAYAAAQTAKQMFDLYDQAVLPQAELARDAAQASYTVGNVDFLTVLTSYTAIYSYELDYHRQRADYEIAVARILGLTGDLDAPSAPEAP
jgi:outer membrane protein TolC